jgi:hypothetical protein
MIFWIQKYFFSRKFILNPEIKLYQLGEKKLNPAGSVQANKFLVKVQFKHTSYLSLQYCSMEYLHRSDSHC